MNAEELTEMTIEAELWAREILREFSENWDSTAPLMIETEDEVTPSEDVLNGLES